MDSRYHRPIHDSLNLSSPSLYQPFALLIENRPEELFKLPNYGCLPSGRFQIDLNGALGDFLGHDLFDLDGNQPIEGNILKLTGGLINVNPSDEAIEFYRERGDDFQMRLVRIVLVNECQLTSKCVQM